MTFLALTAINLKKDLRLEFRSRDTLNALGFFALLVVVIFSFSFANLPTWLLGLACAKAFGLAWAAFKPLSSDAKSP